jgi:hypothetical protein
MVQFAVQSLHVPRGTETLGNLVYPVSIRRFEPEVLNMKQNYYPLDSDAKGGPFKSSLCDDTRKCEEEKCTKETLIKVPHDSPPL